MFFMLFFQHSCVLKELRRISGTLFWSNKVTRSKHLVIGEKIHLSKLEGGLGLRTMFDISKNYNGDVEPKISYDKILCGLSIYEANSYTCSMERGFSVWKNMLQNRECIEKTLWWEPKGGTILSPLHLSTYKCTNMSSNDWW